MVTDEKLINKILTIFLTGGQTAVLLSAPQPGDSSKKHWRQMEKKKQQPFSRHQTFFSNETSKCKGGRVRGTVSMRKCNHSAKYCPSNNDERSSVPAYLPGKERPLWPAMTSQLTSWQQSRLGKIHREKSDCRHEKKQSLQLSPPFVFSNYFQPFLLCSIPSPPPPCSIPSSPPPALIIDHILNEVRSTLTDVRPRGDAVTFKRRASKTIFLFFKTVAIVHI